MGPYPCGMSTVAEFRAHFPEFQNAPETLIQAKLNEATLEVDPDQWGPKTDSGIRYLTAHKLALSPWGTAARLAVQTKMGTIVTTYQTHYESLVAQVYKGGLVL